MDRQRFDADPDPDPSFYIDADPDLDPDLDLDLKVNCAKSISHTYKDYLSMYVFKNGLDKF